MSVRVMSQVWELQLPDSEKIVLLALADCANDEGHCWPGMASLVRKCSKSDRTIQFAIKNLCDAGHMTRREVLGKGCNYTIHPQPPKPLRPEETSPRRERTPPPKPLRGTPEAASGKPSKNRKEPSTLSESELPDWLPRDAWAAFVTSRKATPKVPFTTTAAQRIIAKLDTLRGEGHDPEKLLLLAVERGWRSIFADESTKASTKPMGVEDQRDWFLKNAAFYERIHRPDDAERARANARRIEADNPQLDRKALAIVKQVTAGMAVAGVHPRSVGG